MIGIGRQDFHLQKHELQIANLDSVDEYQLSHLGGFERLFPPMTHYHKTENTEIG
jgi:hypothetical protein